MTAIEKCYEFFSNPKSDISIWGGMAITKYFIKRQNFTFFNNILGLYVFLVDRFQEPH